MTQFAALVTGQRHVDHIPRVVLRVAGVALAPFRPGQARLARTAVVQDTADLSFDPHASLVRHPWLHCTPVGTVVSPHPTEFELR